MWKRGGQKFLREEGRFSAPSRSFYSKVMADGTSIAYTLGTAFKPAAQAVGVAVALGPVVSERVTHVPLVLYAGSRALL